MLERSSLGYKGLVPRISYSRYFTVDNAGASDEDMLEEARFQRTLILQGMAAKRALIATKSSRVTQ